MQNPETIKHLTNILKTNVAACTSIGHPFVIQLGKIYLDLLNLYKCISEMISNTIARNGMVLPFGFRWLSPVRYCLHCTSSPLLPPLHIKHGEFLTRVARFLVQENK